VQGASTAAATAAAAATVSDEEVDIEEEEEEEEELELVSDDANEFLATPTSTPARSQVRNFNHELTKRQWKAKCCMPPKNLSSFPSFQPRRSRKEVSYIEEINDSNGENDDSAIELESGSDSEQSQTDEPKQIKKVCCAPCWQILPSETLCWRMWLIFSVCRFSP
jgi:hypothetical protein